MDLGSLRQRGVVHVTDADVGQTRERVRRTMLRKLCLVLGPLALWLWYRAVTANPIGLPRLTSRMESFMPAMILILLLGGAVLIPLLGAGRSPHVLFRPNDIDVTLDDVKG